MLHAIALAEAMRTWFAAMDTLERPFRDWYETDKGHGRVETRRCVVSNDVAWLRDQGQHWCGLTSMVMVEARRECVNGRRRGR